MSTNPSSGLKVPGTRSRVHSDRLTNNEAIGDELPDSLAGVCIADFVGLVGVQPSKANELLLGGLVTLNHHLPDLSLAASNNGCRKALLGTKINPETICQLRE